MRLMCRACDKEQSINVSHDSMAKTTLLPIDRYISPQRMWENILCQYNSHTYTGYVWWACLETVPVRYYHIPGWLVSEDILEEVCIKCTDGILLEGWFGNDNSLGIWEASVAMMMGWY